ncbi:hypothetical protein ACQ4PT_001000 [Festuca glaucescens]
MADLVVGLAKSVVEGALTKAQSAIEEETQLRQSAQQDLVFITGEFEMMHSFLIVATKERVENKVVMTWVRQVRELAYDVEDCIEFVVHLDTKTSWWWRLIPSWCMAPPPTVHALDEAVSEIEQLKARVEHVSTRNARYSLISDSGSKPVTHHQAATTDATAVSSTAFNMLVEARDTARRGQGLGDLTELITNKHHTNGPPRTPMPTVSGPIPTAIAVGIAADSCSGSPLQVISVWGTGGDLGTTSIIRKAYNDPEISKIFPCRSWVKLTHPFNPREFVRRFMAQVYANSCEQEEDASVGVHVLTKLEANQEDLLNEFVEAVNSKTYLVVLENLTDMVDWDDVRRFLPDKKNGSWIIVSTQQFDVASLCIGHSYQPLELKQFSPEHSVCAFIKEGSQDCGDKDEKLALSQVGQKFSNGETPSKREAATYWIKNYPLVGRETEMNELGNYTAKACFSNSRVVSVWGIAGIGKSALVRNLYYDFMLHSDQFNMYSWVDVSHPFNLRDFSRSLISDHQSQKDPIKECCELLSKRHCLVVIDDLRSKEEWDLIQAALVSKSSTSVIIVITTESSIATYCTNNEEQVFNVKGLEADAAMDLFRKEVHKENSSSALYDHVAKELKELIFKCGGLPKVIVSIASLLATQTVTSMDTVRSLNDKFMHHLETNPEYDSLRGLFDWMYNYFRTCPDFLKPCIFYLSIFPRGHNIRRRRLVRRWIAEGYSRDSEEESAVDKGENFFSKLLDLSIIQQIPQLVTTAFNDTRMVACQVNGFIREYIVSRRMEENLVFELGPNCILTTQRTGRHLIILEGWDRDIIVFESIDFSRLRSLTVFGKWESFFISKSMRLLRVLDLEDALGVKDEDLKTMVQWMLRLKFLSLRGCSEISCLPNSLGDLRQLQTLDVRHTRIVSLPASIGKLQKLQYIRAGTKVLASTPPALYRRLLEFRKGPGLVGVKVRRGIGKLTALHTLGVVNVGASGAWAIVEELKKLTQLRKLGVSGINKHNSKKFFSETSGLVHLESLLVQLDKGSQNCLDDITLPWENLQSYTVQTEDPQEDGKLHFHSEMVGLELDTFKKVKILEVTCRSSLNVIFGSKSMKNLELLKIDCSIASYQLTSLDHLCELKEVLIKGTNDEAKKKDLENLLANHPKKPTVKLADQPRSS